jgi:hypothetical protein
MRRSLGRYSIACGLEPRNLVQRNSTFCLRHFVNINSYTDLVFQIILYYLLWGYSWSTQKNTAREPYNFFPIPLDSELFSTPSYAFSKIHNLRNCCRALQRQTRQDDVLWWVYINQTFHGNTCINISDTDKSIWIREVTDGVSKINLHSVTGLNKKTRAFEKLSGCLETNLYEWIILNY